MIGVDVSSANHPNGAPINWAAVKASGVSFAIVKVSEGTTYINPYARADIEGARAAGLEVAAYFFLDAGPGGPQAEWFMRNCPPGVAGVAIDAEAPGVGAQTVLEASRQLGSAYVQKLYCSEDSWPQYAASWTGLTWIADYSVSVPPVGCDCWQSTSAAVVPGITVTTDRDLWINNAVYNRFFGVVDPAPKPVPLPEGVNDMQVLFVNGQLVVVGNAEDNGNLMVFVRNGNEWGVTDVTETVHNSNPTDPRSYKLAP